MRLRPPPAVVPPVPRGPLSSSEAQRVRDLLRHRPSSADLAELNAIADADVVPGYLIAAKTWDAERVVEDVLREMLHTRYATPFDYWRAL